MLFVRTLFGTGRLGAPIAAEGLSATFGVIAEKGTLDLTLSIDAEGPTAHGEVDAPFRHPAAVRRALTSQVWGYPGPKRMSSSVPDPPDTPKTSTGPTPFA
jgi:hypothetical protein